MTFAVCMPIWRRHGLTALTMQHWRHLETVSPCRFRFVAVGSEGDASRRLAEAHGFEYVEHPNLPLGAKHNAGFRRALELGCDAAIKADSDNWLTPEVLHAYAALLEDHEVIGIRDVYVLRASDFACAYWPGYAGRVDSVGAARCIRRDLLARWHGEICEPMNPEPAYLDLDMTRRVGAGHVVPLADIDGMLLDIKTDVNLNTFEGTGGMPVDVQPVLGCFPAQMVSDLRTLFGKSA